MSITNELRERIDDEALLLSTRRELWNIADRIDAEHERKVAEMTSSWDYWAYTHIELPKDADGEYIHPKDMLTDGKKVYTVTNITFNQCGFIVYGYGDNNRNEWPIDEVSKLHHHHEPTVEDELTDLCERVWESALLGGTWSDSPVESYIAEYAAKLQLRGEGE